MKRRFIGHFSSMAVSSSKSRFLSTRLSPAEQPGVREDKSTGNEKRRPKPPFQIRNILN
jgi:hypothetical protein